MAGWQAYIQNLLDSAKCITKGAIVGSPDGGLWARSEAPVGETFNLDAAECTKFATMFDNIDAVPANGFHAEGLKYIVPRVDESFVLGKCSSQRELGIMAVKTNKAVIIAQFKGESADGVVCRKALEHIADYLRQTGY